MPRASAVTAGGFMLRSRLSRIFLAASLFPFVAQADDPTPVIMVTATRIPTPVQKIPASVTIITRQEMAARGYTTVAQALTAVPGLGIVQSGGPGGQTSVFIRGTNSEDVLVLQDGVPVNDPADPNGAFNFGEDMLAGLERIEIIRGPLSGLYGSGAIGGVINFVSVQGSGKPKADITIAGGFQARGQGSATVSGASGALDYAISGAIDEQAGFDDTARRLAVYAGHRDPFRAKSGALNLGYTPIPGTRVYLILRARDTESAYPDLGYPIYDDPDEYGHDNNAFGKLGVKTSLFDNHLTTELFIARIQDDRHYTNLLDGNDPNFATANDHYHGRRTDAQWTNILRLNKFTSLQFGTEYLDDHASESVNESGFLQKVSASQHEMSGHFGAQTTLYDRLTLSAALRDDAVSSFGNAFTGRIGGVFAIPEIHTRLKASYGTGFLAPSLYDLHGVDNFGYQGNPNLHAEHANGYDAGVSFDLPYSATLSITYFANHINDLIEPTADFTSEQNIGRARVNGVETEFTATPTDWLSAALTYTYTNAVDADAHTELERRPRHSGAATITIKPIPALSITPELRYIGSFTDYLYANSGYPTGVGYAEPGTILNLTVNYQLTTATAAFVQATNLTNSRFEPVNGLQIPGASALFGLRAMF
jgi:vitamin B12 transporter